MIRICKECRAESKMAKIASINEKAIILPADQSKWSPTLRQRPTNFIGTMNGNESPPTEGPTHVKVLHE